METDGEDISREYCWCHWWVGDGWGVARHGKMGEERGGGDGECKCIVEDISSKLLLVPLVRGVVQGRVEK